MRNKRLLSRGTVRSTSALVMLAYVICHLGNHILLLISIPFADEAHHFLVDPWRTIPGTALLLIAVLAHYANALWSIYMRRSLIMPHWGWWQLGLGLSIPLILLLHLASTRISEVEWGVVSDYSSVLLRLWVLAPWKGVTQIALLSAVWAHAAIGLHFWFRTKRWYPRWRPFLSILAIIWPVLALAGYVSAGNQIENGATSGFRRLGTDPRPYQPGDERMDGRSRIAAHPDPYRVGQPGVHGPCCTPLG